MGKSSSSMHSIVRAFSYTLGLFVITICLGPSQSDALPLSLPWRGAKANAPEHQRREEGVAPNSPLLELAPPSVRNEAYKNEVLVTDSGGNRNSQNRPGSDAASGPNSASNGGKVMINYTETVTVSTRNNSGNRGNATDEDTLHTIKLIQLAGASHRRKLASADGEEGGSGNDAENESSGGEDSGQDGQYDGNAENNDENSDSSDDSNSNYGSGGENGSESGNEVSDSSAVAADAAGGGQDSESSESTSGVDRESISVTSPEFAHTVRTGVDGGGIGSRHAHTNLTHLSSMLLKLIKSYNIKSVADIPCRNSLEFFPKLLPTLDFEVMGFKYYCIDSEKDSHEDIAHLFGDAGNPEILHMKPTETSMLPKTDLVFSWDGPQDWGVTKTWTFFANLRIIRPKYLLVTNNPTELNADKAGVLNLRKQPFHFAQANRVIAKVHGSENPALGLPKKQLLFYQIDDIRRGF